MASGWGRGKQGGVRENFNTLSRETRPEVSLQSATLARATFKGRRKYLTLLSYLCCVGL